MLVPVTVSLGMAQVYQGQLPAACLVKESSVVVVVTWVLPPALRSCSVFTGPMPGAVHTFSVEIEVKLPTFVTMDMVTSVAR